MRNRRTGVKLNLERKIKGRQELKRTIPRLKRQGKKIVFTNGCFDLLHYGHAKYLQDARNLGNILIVGINSDISVRRIKGKKRPITSQAFRLKLIAAMESVDFVTLFNELTPLELIKSLKPDILVKGADWDLDKIVGSGTVKAVGGKVKQIKFVRGLSTTVLIEKIAKLYNHK